MSKEAKFINNRKVAFFIYSLQPNGVSKSLETIVNNLDKQKYYIEIIILVKSNFLLDTTIKCRTLYNNEHEFMFRNQDEDYSKELEDFDVLISYSCIVTAYYISKINSKSKKYSFIHGEFKSNHNSYTKEYLIDIYSKMDKIISVSNFVEKSIKEYIGNNIDEKLMVIYNPIDIGRINMLANIDMKKEKFIILSIARLSKGKGVDRIIRVHKRLIEENIENELIILGEGEIRKDIEKLIQELNISNTCKLKGQVDNPYCYIKNCDLFVLLSDSEGLPLSIMESMVLAKPIVASDIESCRELLESNLGLITKLDEEDIYFNIKNMIINEKLRFKYTEYLQNITRFKFDKDIIISKIEELISSSSY